MERDRDRLVLTAEDIYRPSVRGLMQQAAAHVKRNPKEMQNGFDLVMAIKAMVHGHYNTTIIMALAMVLEQMLNEALYPAEEGDSQGPPRGPVA